jgi:hypothetical protein
MDTVNVAGITVRKQEFAEVTSGTDGLVKAFDGNSDVIYILYLILH